MKARIFILTISVLIGQAVFAQNLNQLLDSAKRNSPQIKALDNFLEAKKIESKTNILPDDPKLGFGFFPSAINSNEFKQTLSVSQTFDFPTKYFTRSKLSQLNVLETEELIKLEKLNILTEFQNSLNQYAYCLKRELLIEKRLEALKGIQTALEKKFELGDATYLESQKAKIEMSKVTSDLFSIQSKKHSIVERINYHTGMDLMEIDNLNYPEYNSFELADLIMARIANNPELAVRQIQIKQNEQSIKLAKSSWIPSFEIGFEMERTSNENFRGLGFGMSLPLWNNLNKVKLEKARFQIQKVNYENDLMKFKSETKSMYFEMLGMEKSYLELNQVINQIEFKDMLKRAFDLGEMSVIEYFNELKIMFDLQDQLLETEKEYKILQTTLYNYTLFM